MTAALLNAKSSLKPETDDPTAQAKAAVALQWLSLLSAVFSWISKPSITQTVANQMVVESGTGSTAVAVVPSEVEVTVGTRRAESTSSRVGSYHAQEERMPLFSLYAGSQPGLNVPPGPTLENSSISQYKHNIKGANASVGGYGAVYTAAAPPSYRATSVDPAWGSSFAYPTLDAGSGTAIVVYLI